MRLSSFTAFLLFLMATSACLGWGGHSKMTHEVLKDVPWVTALEFVEITPMTYDVEPMNGSYEFKYVEGGIGETTDALTILSTYADEPDWGPDQELRLSWQQKFMGGYTGKTSRGYIHCYYPAGSFNIPVPGIAMGMTPKRIEQIFALVKEAVAKGDTYWALRFTAWCLHYIQDLTQPYHSTQTSPIFYWKNNLPEEFVKGTTKVTGNYHFAYERFAVWRIKRELDGLENEHFIEALATEGETIIADGKSLACFAKKVARSSHKLSKRAFRDTKDFFGEKFYVAESVLPDESDYAKPGEGDSKERLQTTMYEGFKIFAKATRTLSKQTYKLLDERAARRETISLQLMELQ